MHYPEGTTRLGRFKRREGGQALVESAIVLPMYVFMLLGILQLGLIHQARLLTKYAAYKAVRSGALHNANVKEMEKTALWALLPMISKASSGTEVIKPVATPTDYETKWLEFGVMRQGRMLPIPMRYVEVAICGPTQAAINWKTKEVDFDDPQVATAAVAKGNATQWKDFDRTKLRVQVTFNYRMPIPFANAVFFRMAMGKELTRALYLGDQKGLAKAQRMQRYAQSLGTYGMAAYEAASQTGSYVWPIRASYSMRMQSNVYKSNLPSNDASQRNGDCKARWL